MRSIVSKLDPTIFSGKCCILVKSNGFQDSPLWSSSWRFNYTLPPEQLFGSHQESSGFEFILPVFWCLEFSFPFRYACNMTRNIWKMDFFPSTSKQWPRWKKGDTLPVVFISEDCLDVVIICCEVFFSETWHLKIWKFRMISAWRQSKIWMNFIVITHHPNCFSTWKQ